MHSVHISFCHDISFIEPQKNKTNNFSNHGPHSIMLLDTEYKIDVFNFIPKLFTITTRNGSSIFNTEMIVDASSVISEMYKKDPQIHEFHLDIADEENVLEKFSQLFQGKTITFTDEDLLISYKIVRTLQILNCPNFMKPYELQKQETIPRLDTINSENEAVIDFTTFNNFLLHKFFKCFTIFTTKKAYKCRLYAVYSSQVIRDFLKSNPEADQYEYQFDDTNGEFDIICKLFNFERITITKDNMVLLNKIIEDLQITYLVEPMKNFNEKFDKLSEQFHNQQIDLIEEILDRLYHLNKQNVIEIENKILKNENFEKEEEVTELAAYFFHYIKTDDSHNDELFELLDYIVKNCKDSSPLKQLINIIIKQLLYFLGINKPVCAFTYKLYEHGYIQKDQLFDSINQISKDHYNIFKHFCCPYKTYDSKNPRDDNKDFISHIIFSNLNCWFLPELIEIGLYGKLNPSMCNCITENDSLFNTDLNLSRTCQHKSSSGKKNSINDIRTENFLNEFLPDKLDRYDQMRKNFNSCDELTLALRNDDLDKLQKILSNEIIVPFNMYEDYISNGSTDILNYAAAYGSLKCFKYLSDKFEMNHTTFELAVYGGNIEIVKLVELQQMNKLDLFTYKNIDFNSLIVPAIARHHNDIFDYLLDQQLKKRSFSNQDNFDTIMIMSCKNGNFHSLIQIIKKGYNLSKEFDLLANLAAANGYHKILTLLCQINKNKQPQLLALQRDSVKRKYQLFIFSVMTENISNLKMFTKFSSEFQHAIFDYAIFRGFKSIIKYQLDKYFYTFSDDNIYNCLNDALSLQGNDIFIYLFDQIQSKFYDTIDDPKLISILLIKACTTNKSESAKILIQFIILHNPKYDFSKYFITAIANNSIDICKYIIDNKLFINYFKILPYYDSIRTTNKETFDFFINNVPHEVKQTFINDNLNVAIKNKNIHMIEYLLKEKADSSNSLIEAAKTNNIEVVNIVLKYIDPIFINNKSKEGTALCIACRNSNYDIVSRLLQIEDIDINQFGQDNMTALNIAIDKINVKIINLLLDFYGENLKNETDQLNKSMILILYKVSGANNKRIKNLASSENKANLIPIFKKILKVENIDLNCCAGDYTLLSFASEINDIEIVEFLLKSNQVNINLTGPNNGNTALMNSIKYQNYEISKILLKEPNIDINLCNYEKETSLIYAVENESIEIIDLLIKHDKFNATKSFLNYAFYISTLEISKKLISLESLDVNYVAKNLNKIINFSKMSDLCTTKLINAVSSTTPNEEMIDLIINHPSFDKEKSLAKFALFKTTCKNINIKIFKKLLSVFDNDVNIVNEDGSSLLTSAIKNKNEQLIVYILNNPKLDCDENEIIDLFITSLLFSDIQPLIFKYVEEHRDSIDFNFKSKNGLTIFTAIINNFCFKSKNNDNNETHSKYFEINKYISNLVKFLCDNGADLNIPDNNGNYPFELCLKYYDQNSIISYFTHALCDSKKIDFSTKIYDRLLTESFTTYLHLAMRINSSIIEKLIKDKSIDINITDSFNETPLITACRSKKNRIIQLLFQRDDLDYLHRNNEGKDALMIYYNSNEQTEAIQDKNEYLKRLLKNTFTFGSSCTNFLFSLNPKGKADDKTDNQSFKPKFEFKNSNSTEKNESKTNDQPSKFELKINTDKKNQNSKTTSFNLNFNNQSSKTSSTSSTNNLNSTPNNSQPKKLFSFNKTKENSESKTTDQPSEHNFEFNTQSKLTSGNVDQTPKQKFNFKFDNIKSKQSTGNSSNTNPPSNSNIQKNTKFSFNFTKK